MHKRRLLVGENREACLSFEEFFLSKYYKIPFDRNIPCIICKRATLVGFSYNDVTIQSHSECLSLMLFYEFMNNLNVTQQDGVLSLSKILDLQPILKQIGILRNKCYSCDARNVFFKCATEGCSNYMHLHCAGNGFIIVDNDTSVKKVNYRFLLCQNHLKQDEISIVKCRFLSKLSLTKEYLEIHNANNSKLEVLMNAQVDVKVPFTSYKGLANNSRYKINYVNRSVRNEGKTYGYNASKYQPKFSGKTMSRSISKSDISYGPQTSYSLTNSQYMQSITALMVEYNTVRRNSNQKNTRAFEWWPYDILFAKIRPDIFDDAPISDDDPLYYLYGDIKDVLKLRTKCSLINFRRILNVNEYSIQSILNSILLQLNHNVDLSTSYRKLSLSSNIVQSSNIDDANVTSVPQTCDADLIKSEPCRPTFALAHFNNKAVWFSFIFLKTDEDVSKPESVILEYMPLSMLDYEYCRRVIRSLYYLPNSKFRRASVIPLITPTNVETCKKNSDDGIKMSMVLNGYAWDLEPPLYTMALEALKRKPNDISNILESNKSSSVANIMDLCDLNDVIDSTKQYDDVIKGMSKNNFVGKQSVALMIALNAVNKSISYHKKRILEKISTEYEYYNRNFDDKTHVDESRETFGHMHRWSHFKSSFQESVEKFMSSMTCDSKHNDESEEAEENITSKEYCSVCLRPELSHKHILQQCNRCCMRVHHRCYASYRPDVEPKLVGSQDDSLNLWLCDPCEFEEGLNPGCEYIGNNAICCICFSSGGAMKRVLGSVDKNSEDPPLWAHLICVVFLMPKISCYDLYSLNLWNLKNVEDLKNVNSCSVCTFGEGYMLKCSSENCDARFHPLCAWVGGIHVEYSPTHNISILSGMIRCDMRNTTFPSICLRPYCIQHTTQLFSKKIVQEQCSKRSFAYTHYLYHPDPFGKNRIQNSVNLPLELVYSPVTISKNGAIRTPYKQTLRKDRIKRTMLGSFDDRLVRPVVRNDSIPPTMISVVYGLPRSSCGEAPRYGIHAIATFLRANRHMNCQRTSQTGIAGHKIPLSDPHLTMNNQALTQQMEIS